MKYRTWIATALLLSALVPAAVIASACGGSSQSNSATTPTDHPAAAATIPAASSSQTVRTVEGPGDPRTAWGFDPAQISIRKGDAISFTNAGKEAHTATADDASFDTGTLSAGDARPITFVHAGTFAYHCSLHPWMKGTIVVAPAQPRS